MSSIEVTVLLVFLLALLSMLVAVLITAIRLSRLPKTDRVPVEGIITDVYKNGKGIRVQYVYKDREYSVLQIVTKETPVNADIGSSLTVYVNPFVESNASLIQRPVRDDKKFTYLVLALLSLCAFYVPVMIIMTW